jgi:hypothetical protein
MLIYSDTIVLLLPIKYLCFANIFLNSISPFPSSFSYFSSFEHFISLSLSVFSTITFLTFSFWFSLTFSFLFLSTCSLSFLLLPIYNLTSACLWNVTNMNDADHKSEIKYQELYFRKPHYRHEAAAWLSAGKMVGLLLSSHSFGETQSAGSHKVVRHTRFSIF